MKPKRALAVTGRIFHSLRHDRRSIILILLAPILAMVLFGIAFSEEVHDVDVVVVNNDEGGKPPGTNVSVRISQMIIDEVDSGKVDIRYENNESEALNLVEAGKCNTMVLFPSNFTENALKSISDGGNGQSSMIMRSDNSQVNVASEVKKEFSEALASTIDRLGGRSPIRVDSSEAVYGENAEFIDMFVPGIMGFIVFLITTILTLISFVGERSGKTLDRLFANSVTEGEMVAGYAVAFSVIGMVQVGILLVLAILIFDVMVVGNPLIAFLIASILAVVSVSLGILLSSLAKRESQAIQFLPTIILPGFLLSGVFWPLEAMPDWLLPVSYLIPVTYAVEGLRSVMLRGWTLGEIWLDITALLGFAAVFLTGAVLSLKATRRR